MPLSGDSSPARRLNSVVLPFPFFPIIAMRSSFLIAMLSSSIRGEASGANENDRSLASISHFPKKALT